MIKSHPNALPPGTRLEEFEIQGVLGIGGFGITYIGREAQLDWTVAIKEFFPQDIAFREPSGRIMPKTNQFADAFRKGVESFRHEAKTLTRFRHKNIIQIHRFFVANGTAYFVMQYMEGFTLAELLRRSRRPIPEQYLLGEVTDQLLSGLKELHRNDVYHRDIKPSNIYLREGREPVLIDFGAARQIVGGVSMDVSRVVTEGFAPFEQYTGRSPRIGPWTDIYALGATLYMCVTGEVPAKSPDRVGFDARNDPVIPAAKLAGGKGYSGRFLSAIDRFLAVRIENRPQNCDQARLLLEGVKQTEGPTPAVVILSVLTVLAGLTLLAMVLLPAQFKELIGTSTPTARAEMQESRRTFDWQEYERQLREHLAGPDAHPRYQDSVNSVQAILNTIASFENPQAPADKRSRVISGEGGAHVNAHANLADLERAIASSHVIHLAPSIKPGSLLDEPLDTQALLRDYVYNGNRIVIEAGGGAAAAFAARFFFGTDAADSVTRRFAARDRDELPDAILIAGGKVMEYGSGAIYLIRR